MHEQTISFTTLTNILYATAVNEQQLLSINSARHHQALQLKHISATKRQQTCRALCVVMRHSSILAALSMSHASSLKPLRRRYRLSKPNTVTQFLHVRRETLTTFPMPTRPTGACCRTTRSPIVFFLRAFLRKSVTRSTNYTSSVTTVLAPWC